MGMFGDVTIPADEYARLKGYEVEREKKKKRRQLPYYMEEVDEFTARQRAPKKKKIKKKKPWYTKTYKAPPMQFKNKSIYGFKF